MKSFEKYGLKIIPMKVIFSAFLKFVLTPLISIIFVLIGDSYAADVVDVVDDVDALYAKARSVYDIGGYPEAMGYVDKAKKKILDIGDNPSVFVLSGMINFKLNNCVSALDDVSKARIVFDELSELMVQKKLNKIEYMGVEQYTVYNDNYFLATKISAFCNYTLDRMDRAIKDFIYVEKRWPREFDYQYKARLAHAFQMEGYDRSAIAYYLSVLSELSNNQEGVKNKNKYIESSRYNIIISYDRMGNIENAVRWGEKLLSESASPIIWIEKMEKDPDYKKLLVNKEFSAIISRYK